MDSQARPLEDSDLVDVGQERFFQRILHNQVGTHIQGKVEPPRDRLVNTLCGSDSAWLPPLSQPVQTVFYGPSHSPFCLN